MDIYLRVQSIYIYICVLLTPSLKIPSTYIIYQKYLAQFFISDKKTINGIENNNLSIIIYNYDKFETKSREIYFAEVHNRG